MTMKKRLLACLLTAAMLTSLFPLPALAAEAERPEWMVTAFDPLDGDIAAQTVPQGGEPVLPDSLTAWAYVIEDDTAVIPPPEGLEQESEQPQTDGPDEAEDNQLPVDGQEGPEDEQLPSDSTGEPFAPLTEAMVENELEPAEKQEPDVQPVTIPSVTWEAQPEFDPDTPGEYVYTPVLPAAYEVAGEVELPVISVTVTAAEQTALQRVQAMIDALPAPEDITPDNRDEVEAQLEAIGEAWAELSDEEALQLDTARLEAAWDALAALDGQTGNELPAPQVETADGVEYWDENGSENTKDGVAVIDSTTTTWSGSWYVVNSNVKMESRVTVNGDVHLILADNVELTVNGGITITDSNSLTIYGQTSGTGVLNTTGGAGSDGGDTPGTVNGGDGDAGIASTDGAITINGGTVNATGGAGGNGGIDYEGYNGGDGGDGGTGIASTSGSITIHGGTMNITGGAGGNGGNGDNGHGGDGGAGISSTNKPITIHSGTVNITGGVGGRGGKGTMGNFGRAGIDGAGIDGAFSTGTEGTTLIMASSIRNNEDTSKWGGIIFEGTEGQVYGDQTIQIDFELPDDHTLTIPADTNLTVPENATLTNNGTLINDGTFVNNGKVINDGTLINDGSITNIDAIKGDGTIDDYANQSSGDPVSYWTCDQSGQNWNREGRSKYYVVEESTTTWGVGYERERWYVVNRDVEISNRITVSGDVHLI